jgi:DNA repair ATPase RecN
MKTAVSQIEVSQEELLEDKLYLLERVRDLTEAADLSKDNKEENYITLIARREAIMNKLRAIDSKLKKTEPVEGIDHLLNRISEICEQVLELDEEISKKTPEMINGLKSSIRRLKNGKSINKAYNATITEGFYKKSR